MSELNLPISEAVETVRQQHIAATVYSQYAAVNKYAEHEQTEKALRSIRDYLQCDPWFGNDGYSNMPRDVVLTLMLDWARQHVSEVAEIVSTLVPEEASVVDSNAALRRQIRAAENFTRRLRLLADE